MSESTILLGDIGGTHARFALACDNRVGYELERVFRCDNFASAESAIQQYLEGVSAPSVRSACLAVAGPVATGKASLTNNHWFFDEEGVRAALGCEKVRLLNDFEAAALGLAYLGPADLTPVGEAKLPDLRQAEYVVAVVGPGTGFGAATLIKRDGRLTSLSGEAGHVGFAPESPLQVELLASLADQFGRVSVERLVSGSGLVNIFNFLATRSKAKTGHFDAAAIFLKAKRDQTAQKAVALFFELLGQAAGNFVLATGSFDGLFIAGGIVQRYPELLHNSTFRSGFEKKGRHSELMRAIPTVLVRHPLPGLLGAAAAAKNWH